MATLDLDARRAARAETLNQPHAVTFGGESFQFPPRMPLECLDLMRDGQMRAAVALFFEEDPDAIPAGGPITARFFKHRPDDLDLEAIMKFYGQGPGEAFSGSPTSSTNGGVRRKRTSKRSTAATSQRTATAPTT